MRCSTHDPIRRTSRSGMASPRPSMSLMRWTRRRVEFIDGLPALPAVAVCVVGLLIAVKGSRTVIWPSVLRSNFEGPASVLGLLANRLEAWRRHHRGDRWWPVNVAGLQHQIGSVFTAFLSGLQPPCWVNVWRPFCRGSQNTDDRGLCLPGFLTAPPAAIANLVHDAVKTADVAHSRCGSSSWRSSG